MNLQSAILTLNAIEDEATTLVIDSLEIGYEAKRESFIKALANNGKIVSIDLSKIKIPAHLRWLIEQIIPALQAGASVLGTTVVAINRCLRDVKYDEAVLLAQEPAPMHHSGEDYQAFIKAQTMRLLTIKTESEKLGVLLDMNYIRDVHRRGDMSIYPRVTKFMVVVQSAKGPINPLGIFVKEFMPSILEFGAELTMPVRLEGSGSQSEPVAFYKSNPLLGLTISELVERLKKETSDRQAKQKDDETGNTTTVTIPANPVVELTTVIPFIEIDALITALTDNLIPGLKELIINGINMSTKQIAALLTGLISNKHLEKLTLVENAVTQETTENTQSSIDTARFLVSQNPRLNYIKVSNHRETFEFSRSADILAAAASATEIEELAYQLRKEKEKVETAERQAEQAQQRAQLEKQAADAAKREAEQAQAHAAALVAQLTQQQRSTPPSPPTAEQGAASHIPAPPEPPSAPSIPQLGNGAPPPPPPPPPGFGVAAPMKSVNEIVAERKAANAGKQPLAAGVTASSPQVGSMAAAAAEKAKNRKQDPNKTVSMILLEKKTAAQEVASPIVDPRASLKKRKDSSAAPAVELAEAGATTPARVSSPVVPASPVAKMSPAVTARNPSVATPSSQAQKPPSKPKSRVAAIGSSPELLTGDEIAQQLAKDNSAIPNLGKSSPSTAGTFARTPGAKPALAPKPEATPVAADHSSFAQAPGNSG